MPTPRIPPNLRPLRGLPPVIVPTVGGGAELPADPPSWLPEEGRKEWLRIVAACVSRPGWLQAVDQALLTAYCATWATFVAAAQQVAEWGPLVRGRSSADAARGDAVLVRNSAVAIQRDAAATLRSLCTQLGFSPESRTKLALTEPAGGDDDSDLLTS